MKNLIIAFLTVILFSCSPVQSQSTNIDMVDVNTLNFKRIATGGSIGLMATTANITTAFGTPQSTSQVISEIDNLTYSILTYSGIKISLLDGSLNTINITTTSVGLIFNNVTIKVGSDINNLSSLFPGSFALRSNDRMSMLIGLHHNGEIIDQHIVIGFNAYDKITYIGLAD